MNEHLLYVVDDETIILSVIRRVAEEIGYQVQTFSNAPDFEEAVRSRMPDLIMLDISIGQHDGLHLLHGLARINCPSPIMMCSGFDDRMIRSTVRVGDSLGLAMLEPTQKPFKIPVLREVLTDIARTKLPIRPNDINRAVNTPEMVPYYQPKVRVSDRKLVGAEALVRWNHPERGVLAPGVFLPITEDGPHITPLTFSMIAWAMRDSLKWRAMGSDISVAVNVSAKSLMIEDFAERVAEIVSISGASPSNLTLEITETAAMSDASAVLTVLTRLRIMGFSLSMDDFGTGYSSMKELHRMPFTEIKVDRSFVTGMCHDNDARTITTALVGLGRTMGLTTVAEGVESEDVMALLADIGCDVAQGYLIGKPMPGDVFATWLSNRDQGAGAAAAEVDAGARSDEEFLVTAR